MYDVIETEIHGDSLYYFCWVDHEETLLNKKLNQLLASVMANPLKENKEHKRIIDFYKSLSLPENIHIPLANVFYQELIFPKYPSDVINFFSSIPSSPKYFRQIIYILMIPSAFFRSDDSYLFNLKY